MAFHDLDDLELATWKDRQWMPRKQRIWAKLEHQLVDLLSILPTLPGAEQLPPDWTKNPPRIHRGENYQAYSYRALDIFTYSQQSSHILLRLLLLWGHPPAIHLIAKGQPQEWCVRRLTGRNLHAWHLDLGDSPWDWFPFPLSAKPWNQHWAQLRAADHPYFKLSCWKAEVDPSGLEAFATAQVGELLAALSPPPH